MIYVCWCSFANSLLFWIFFVFFSHRLYMPGRGIRHFSYFRDTREEEKRLGSSPAITSPRIIKRTRITRRGTFDACLTNGRPENRSHGKASSVSDEDNVRFTPTNVATLSPAVISVTCRACDDNVTRERTAFFLIVSHPCIVRSRRVTSIFFLRVCRSCVGSPTLKISKAGQNGLAWNF